MRARARARERGLASDAHDLARATGAAVCSNDVFEDVKVKKSKIVEQPDGTQLLKMDFSYTLLTRAGFTVNRKGIASALVANEAVVGIVSATTELRYKEMSTQLDTMTDSFRAYSVKAPAFGPGSLI